MAVFVANSECVLSYNAHTVDSLRALSFDPESQVRVARGTSKASDFLGFGFQSSVSQKTDPNPPGTYYIGP